IERDLQRRRLDRLDPDAADRPQQGRGGDEQSAAPLVGSGIGHSSARSARGDVLNPRSGLRTSPSGRGAAGTGAPRAGSAGTREAGGTAGRGGRTRGSRRTGRGSGGARGTRRARQSPARGRGARRGGTPGGGRACRVRRGLRPGGTPTRAPLRAAGFRGAPP